MYVPHPLSPSDYANSQTDYQPTQTDVTPNYNFTQTQDSYDPNDQNDDEYDEDYDDDDGVLNDYDKTSTNLDTSTVPNNPDAWLDDTNIPTSNPNGVSTADYNANVMEDDEEDLFGDNTLNTNHQMETPSQNTYNQSTSAFDEDVHLDDNDENEDEDLDMTHYHQSNQSKIAKISNLSNQSNAVNYNYDIDDDAQTQLPGTFMVKLSKYIAMNRIHCRLYPMNQNCNE